MRPYSPEAHRRVAEHQRRQMTLTDLAAEMNAPPGVVYDQEVRGAIDRLKTSGILVDMVDDRRIIRRSWWSRIVMWWES